MKKEILVLLMVVSSAVVLSAAGNQENTDEQFYGRGAARGGMMGSDADRNEFFAQRQAERDEYVQDLELITVNGSLTLINGELPTIDSNGTTYSFMAPWIQVQDLELENGMAISVEGYEMPGQPLQWDSAEKSLMVTKAVVNGEEIKIDHEAGTYGMMGSRGFGGPGKSGRGGAAANGGMMGRRF